MYFMQEIEWLIVRLADAGMQVSTPFLQKQHGRAERFG